MKLYVVGESSGDSAKWSIWTEYSLVIAATPENALDLAGVDKNTPVSEVEMDRPMFLCKMPEPGWGPDL